MLDHPWIKDISSKRVNMSRFLSKVWGWDEEPQLADGGTLTGAINPLQLS